MRLSAAVMAHPIREVQVSEQAAWLDRDVPVVWASNPQPTSDPVARWVTGREAWQLYDPSADWHVVLQDDAVPCRDMLAGLELALDEVGDRGVVSAYTGTGRPHQANVTKALDDAVRKDRSWMATWSLNWGVAIAAPTWTIPAMLEWCERPPMARTNYDMRIGLYYRDVMRWVTWYTVPSLVDHADVPSLVSHGGNRFAHRVCDGSALEVDWSAHDGLPVELPKRAVELYGLR